MSTIQQKINISVVATNHVEVYVQRSLDSGATFTDFIVAQYPFGSLKFDQNDVSESFVVSEVTSDRPIVSFKYTEYADGSFSYEDVLGILYDAIFYGSVITLIDSIGQQGVVKGALVVGELVAIASITNAGVQAVIDAGIADRVAAGKAVLAVSPPSFFVTGTDVRWMATISWRNA